MSDDEDDGAVADTRIDWIIERVGDTRPASFKMAEVGIMAIGLAGFWFQSVPVLLFALFLMGLLGFVQLR